MQEIARFEGPDEIPKGRKTDMGWIVIIMGPAWWRMGDHDIQNAAVLDLMS